MGRKDLDGDCGMFNIQCINYGVLLKLELDAMLILLLKVARPNLLDHVSFQV
jgi:hypothetical protein